MIKIPKWIEDNPIKFIVLWGIFLRFILLALYGHATVYPDTYAYFDLAELISRFDLRENNGSRSPGYPLLIVLAFGKSYIVVLYQIVLGIITLLLIYKTLLLLWKNKTYAFFFTFAASCYLPVIFYEFALLTESLTFFLITTLFYVFLLIFFRKKNTLGIYLLLAFLFMALVWVKPFYIYVPFIFLFFLLMRFRRIKSHSLLIFFITNFTGDGVFRMVIYK